MQIVFQNNSKCETLWYVQSDDGQVVNTSKNVVGEGQKNRAMGVKLFVENELQKV